MSDIQPNLNEYNEADFELSFVNTDLYKRLDKDFDRLYFTKNIDKDLFQKRVTPRQFLGERIHYLRPYYYIQKLVENNPEIIYDMGCGWNIFKKYIPNIIGFDSHGSDADRIFVIQPNTLKTLFESCDAALSIDAMHFCSLSEMETTINDFASIIKPNGRGYIALNCQRMLERTNKSELLKLFDTTTPSIEQYDDYIRKILKKINFNYLIVDVDLTTIDEYLNGNISIVFEKRQNDG